MKKQLLLTILLATACLLSGTAYGMQKDNSKEASISEQTNTETITFIASDKKEFEVQKDKILGTFPTLKDMLNNPLSTESKTQKISLEYIDSTTLSELFYCMHFINKLPKVDPKFEYAKHNLFPYTASQIEPIVDKILNRLNNAQKQQFILAAKFLGMKFDDVSAMPRLLNAFATCIVDSKYELWLKKYPNFLDCHTNMKQHIIKKIGLGSLTTDILDDLEPYIKKHIVMQQKGITKEYSVADYINDHIRTHGKQPQITTSNGLVTLKLKNQRLTDLEGLQLIKNINTVQYLDLGYNQLTTIQPGTFNGFDNLINLNLFDNQITTIHVNTFNGLTNLQDLNLGKNQITTLHAHTFNNLTNLQDLNLGTNRITTIQTNTFNSLTSLRKLGLYNNQITTLHANIFNSLTNLRKLGLYNNQITTLHANIFNSLTSLQTLNLGKNKLTTIQPTMFSSLNNLQTLHIISNQLTATIINQIKQALPHVQVN